MLGAGLAYHASSDVRGMGKGQTSIDAFSRQL